MTAKPPYRVPAMDEIRAIPWNGYNAVSTFSGCGGSSLGYRMAGFRVLWASEFVPAAQDTYRANSSPCTVLDTRDIREVDGREILDAAGLGVGDIDLFDGSPPCASFSTAGKRAEGWGAVKPYSDTRQRTDDLFFEFARLIEETQPRVFVAENVSGLVKGSAKGYFKLILARLKGCGYRVEARVLDASWLGVPQARQRLVFVGVRNDLGRAPAFPSPLPYRYTVRDALPWILAQGDNGGFGEGSMRIADRPSPTIGTDPGTGNGNFPPSKVVTRVIHDTSSQWGAGDVTDRPCPTITVGIDPKNAGRSLNSRKYQVHSVGEQTPVTHDPETGQDITIGRYKIGAEWEKLAPGESSSRLFNLTRLGLDRPSPTILQESGLGTAGVTHWAEARKLTLGELRRLSGFPDDFTLTGTYAKRWERIGRAVPPVMMFHIAATIRDQILMPLRRNA